MATAAGVSTATVSRALSGEAGVSENTRTRIVGLAAELGYTPNSFARALRRNRSDIVGIVVPSISNPFFTALVESVEHALQRVEKTLFLCDSRGDVELEAQRIASLRESHVDGILISPCHGELSAPAINAIPAATPVVQLDQFVTGTSSDWVGIDDDAALDLLLTHAAERGARSAVFVSSATTNSSTRARLDSFHKYAARLGIHTGPEDLLLGGFSLDWGEQVGQLLLARPSLPDVVVCGADVIAFGVIRSLSAAGVSIPDRVLVTGFDDIAFASVISPSLTTVRQPTDLLAAEAVRMLMRPRDEAFSKVALSPTLIVRESTGGPRA